jgi:hypothetical protein
VTRNRYDTHYEESVYENDETRTTEIEGPLMMHQTLGELVNVNGLCAMIDSNARRVNQRMFDERSVSE